MQNLLEKYGLYDYKISPYIDNSTFNGMKKIFDDSESINIMCKHEFSYENFILLTGDIKRIQKEFPKFLYYSNGEKMRSDTRKPLEYKMGICASWVVEYFHMDRCNDAFLSIGCNAKMILNGGDKDRIVVCNKGDVSADADYLVISDNVNIQMEHCISYGGYFIREQGITLRNGKYPHLYKNNAIIMAIETFGIRDKSRWLYALIGEQDLNECNFTYKESCGSYNKPGGELHINRKWFMPFDNFINVLCNYLYMCNHYQKQSNDEWIAYLRNKQFRK